MTTKLEVGHIFKEKNLLLWESTLIDKEGKNENGRVASPNHSFYWTLLMKIAENILSSSSVLRSMHFLFSDVIQVYVGNFPFTANQVGTKT